MRRPHSREASQQNPHLAEASVTSTTELEETLSTPFSDSRLAAAGSGKSELLTEVLRCCVMMYN